MGPAATDHSEFSAHIVLGGNWLKTPAKRGWHIFVRGLLSGEHGFDGLRANHVVVGSMRGTTRRYDANPNEAGAKSTSERSCIVGPLFSFGCGVNKDPYVF